MNVLLVDDSKTMRNIQKRALEAMGGVCAEAEDGVQALSVLAQRPQGFDLILVDWNMPNMDGLTFLRRVRETDQKTPMMMVTTEAEKQRIIDAIKAGANNYLIKPFTPVDLVEKVNKLVAKKAA